MEIEWAECFRRPTGGHRVVRAGVLLRVGEIDNPGGVSIWPSGSTSLREAALRRAEFAVGIGRREGQLAFVNQVHGARVVRCPALTESNPDRVAADGGDTPSPEPPSADALYTSEPGCVPVVGVADCCPVVVADPSLPIVGVAHAGRRGCAAGVVPALISALVRAGASLAGITAWIGPCADGDKYEVGYEIAQDFGDYPGAVKLHPTAPDKRLLDITAVVDAQLSAAGLDAGSIAHSGGGTISDARYHSFRRDGYAAGRMAAFVTID